MNMYRFAIHKNNAEEILRNSTDSMPHVMKIMLKIIIEMATEGMKLLEDLSNAYENMHSFEEQRNILAEELSIQIRNCTNCPAIDSCSFKDYKSTEDCMYELIEWCKKEV